MMLQTATREALYPIYTRGACKVLNFEGDDVPTIFKAGAPTSARRRNLADLASPAIAGTASFTPTTRCSTWS